MNYLRRQWLDAKQFLILPGIAALLPWCLGWRWLRWWSRREHGPFDEFARAAVAVAAKHLSVGDQKTFMAQVRLVWLIDYRDFLLSLVCWRRSWYPRYVQRVGAWPSGGFIAAGFHYGACNWLHRILAESNHDCLTVSIRWRKEDYRGFPVRYWVGRMRYWDMQRIDRLPIAYRPGIKPAIKAALQQQAAVLSLVDTPPHAAPRGQRPVRLLGYELSFADGAVALAREAGVPVVPFWIEFDTDFRTRRFHIGEPLDPTDVDATLQALADILDRQVRSLPAAWHFWSQLPQWIEDARAAVVRDTAGLQDQAAANQSS